MIEVPQKLASPSEETPKKKKIKKIRQVYQSLYPTQGGTEGGRKGGRGETMRACLPLQLI